MTTDGEEGLRPEGAAMSDDGDTTPGADLESGKMMARLGLQPGATAVSYNAVRSAVAAALLSCEQEDVSDDAAVFKRCATAANAAI